ncbi:unnamed protein product, partial [Didymodactylos carnosus]
MFKQERRKLKIHVNKGKPTQEEILEPRRGLPSSSFNAWECVKIKAVKLFARYDLRKFTSQIRSDSQLTVIEKPPISVQNLFNFKDNIPNYLKSDVIYNILNDSLNQITTEDEKEQEELDSISEGLLELSYKYDEAVIRADIVLENLRRSLQRFLQVDLPNTNNIPSGAITANGKSNVRLP